VGVAVAYAISSTLVEPVYTVLTARSIQISAWRVLGAVRGVFEAAAGMTACVLVARTALVGWGVPAGARLAICVVIGAAVFAAASAWRAPEAWADLRQILRDALGRRLSRRGAARGGGLAEGQVA
jgi:hypothetical protein